MNYRKALHSCQGKKRLILLSLVFLAGCAGANGAAGRPPGDFVEIENPGLTMSPNAPATIWVPRSYVEKGVPRGGELARQGYDAVTGSKPATARQAAPAGTNPASGVAPAAAVAAPAAPPSVGLVDPAGKPADLLPHFGLVLALEGNRVYFNLGRDDGVSVGQKLKVYRGGTVVKGLGLAPGETVGTLEVSGWVGTNGGYGVMKQGGPVRTNDLIGFE